MYLERIVSLITAKKNLTLRRYLDPNCTVTPGVRHLSNDGGFFSNRCLLYFVFFLYNTAILLFFNRVHRRLSQLNV